MEGIYDTIEAAVIWGTVILVLGLVVYLAYLQCIKAIRRRARHRHRARRARRHSTGPAVEHRPSHNQQS